MWVINFVLGLIPLVGQLATFIVSVPVSYGLVVSFIKLKRGEEVKYTSFLTEGFSVFKKVWCVYGHTLLKMIVPVILVIVFIVLSVVSMGLSIFNSVSLLSEGAPIATTGSSFFSLIATAGLVASLIYAIVKGYLYSLTNYILYDNPNMTGKEIVKESERLMRGNRWKLVWLSITFIGWMILSGFTLGIGLLWVIPYMSVANVCFYEALSGKDSGEVIVESQNDSNENPISE